MLVLEVGLLLDKPLEFYQEILKKAGAVNEFNCKTHDIYWTNKTDEELKEMTENQIKKSCVRFRICSGFGGVNFKAKVSKEGTFDNYHIFEKKESDRFCVKISKLKKYEKLFRKNGWRLIFNAEKIDYQYSIGDMKSRIQIQDIKDLGLVLYYDNPDYYHLDEDAQHLEIIKELNSYGFNFKENMLGIDKLKTFVHKKHMFSKNQNG